MPQTELDLDTVKSILSEYKIHNADVTLRYDATADDLIDVIEGNRSYIPCIYLLNKIGIKNNNLNLATIISFTITTNRSDQRGGVGHHLQDSPLRAHICPSQMELR